MLLKKESNILLYTTSGCHLCEQAEIMFSYDGVNAQMSASKLKLKSVEISQNEALVVRYGLRIPVLQFEGLAPELSWPFGEGEVIAFIQSACRES